MKKIIIEVGSTNTKCFKVEKGLLVEDHFETIEFKKSFLKTNELDEKLIKKLIEVVNRYQGNDTFIFGTSVFRMISRNFKKEFKTRFKKETGFDFHIISMKEENDKVVEAIVKNNNYQKQYAILITGPSSTELTIVSHGKEINSYTYKFGSLDIMNKFPEIIEDVVTVSYNRIVREITKMIGDIEEKADILILAGSNHLWYYNNSISYPLEENKYCYGTLQTKAIKVSIMHRYDKLFFKTSLANYLTMTHYQSFIGNRGIRPIITALWKKLNAKIIIPTYVLTAHGFIKND